MFSTDQASFRNRLITAMPADFFASLIPHLEFKELPLRFTLVDPGEETGAFIFLESGLASIVASSLDAEVAEVGHIGLEGISGAHLLLATTSTPNHTFMQVGGYGAQVNAAVLLDLLAQSEPVRDMFLRYVHCCEIQLAQSALASSRYNMNERLARWLLMCHDRLESDDLTLTHEFLALMLGVRRSGVTNEIHVLEGLDAIRATRGNVHVRDRAKLEEIAAGCYGVAEAEYKRLIGLSLRRH